LQGYSSGVLDAAGQHFVAGFLDGEASFSIQPSNGRSSHVCTFEVAQRDDGADVLFWLRDSLRLGVLTHQPAKRTSRPQVVWRLSAREEALELCRLLEQAPLRSRKRHDFELWRQAVEINAGGGPRRYTRIDGLRQELLALRAFHADEAGRQPLLARAT
jgi:hypothetical protein